MTTRYDKYTTPNGYTVTLDVYEGDYLIHDGDNIWAVRENEDEARAVADRLDAMTEAGDEAGLNAFLDAEGERRPLDDGDALDGDFDGADPGMWDGDHHSARSSVYGDDW